MKILKKVYLKDLVDRKIGYGIVRPGSNVIKGTPVIKVNNIINGLNEISSLDLTTDEISQKYKRTILQGGELVISLVGTVGKTAIVPISLAGCNLVRATGLIDIKDVLLCKWVKYYIDSIYGQTYIKNNLNTTVQPTLNIDALEKMEIPVFSSEYLKRATDVLSSLDDKIKLNNKINANLEQQAQALFKSWFVDFEPFGGEMPAEWKERPLYEYADFINGTSFKEDEYGTVGVPIIKIAELKNGITDATQYFNGTKDSKYDVKDGDILFSWSGNPETSIDIFIWTLGNAILNQHTFNVKSNTNRKWFTYCLLKYFKPEFCHRAGCKQTTGLGHVTANDLKQIMFSSDEKSEIDFENLITPVMEQVYNNKVENQKLASIRDTLLPKLMNGEIEIYK